MTTKEYLIKTSYDNAGIQKMQADFERAKQSARDLGVSLSESARLVNQNVTTSFNRAGDAVRQVTSTITDQGKIMRVVFNDMGESFKAVSVTGQTFGTVAGSIGAEIQKLIGRVILVAPIWEAFRFAMISVIETFQKSVEFMVEWETEMARIRVITGASKEQVDTLSQSLLGLSEKFGISNQEVAKAANEWLKMGATLDTVIPLLDTSAKLSLLSGQSLSESAEHVNVIRSAFELNAGQASEAIDKLIVIQQKSGVSLGVLSAAFAKAGEAARGMGVDFNQLAGYITAVNEKTRESGDTIGTQLRTILLRLGTTAVDTAQNISKVPFYLDQFGKATTEHTPTLRNLNDILVDLAKTWDNLSNAQQVALARALGGRFTINSVVALMENFNAALKASADASEGQANAQKSIAIITDTTAAKVKQLQTNWAEFLQTVSNTGAIKGVLDLLNATISALQYGLGGYRDNIKALENIDYEQIESKIDRSRRIAERKPGTTGNAPISEADTEAQKQKDLNADLETEQQIKNKIQEIEKNAILTREDSLTTIQKELDLYDSVQVSDGKNLEQAYQTLLLKKQRLEVEQELANLAANQSVIEEQLKAEGASQIQIAIAHLAYLKEINASTDERVKAEANIEKLQISEARTIQDQIVTALVTQQKTLGDTAIQQLQTKIALEDQLGIHRQGVDLLKEQLDLYKAITDQTKKTPLQREKELSDLIKNTPRPGQFQNTFATEEREGNLTRLAERRGISNETIQAILHPEEIAKKAGGPNSLQDEIKRALTDPLTTNIFKLADSIQHLAEAVQRPNVSSDLTSNLKYVNPVTGSPITQAQTPGGVPSYAVPFRGKEVAVDLGGVHVSIQAHTKNEAKSELTKILQELIANHIVTPGSKLNKAIKNAVEQF